MCIGFSFYWHLGEERARGHGRVRERCNIYEVDKEGRILKISQDY